MREPGEAHDPNAKRVGNGIQGHARRLTAELGKRIFDMKADYAVRQIRGLPQEREEAIPWNTSSRNC